MFFLANIALIFSRIEQKPARLHKNIYITCTYTVSLYNLLVIEFCLPQGSQNNLRGKCK